MKRRVWLAILWVGVLAASAPTAAGPDPAAIVPGQSLGPIRLGQTTQAFQQTSGWGQPDRTSTSGSISYLAYERRRTTVATRDAQVVMILTTSSRFRTERGVAVGQAAAAATSAYGAATAGGDSRYLWYDGIGLVVVLGAGTIIRIGVFDPKTFVRAILADEIPAWDVFLTARAPAFAAREAADPPGRAATITVTLKNASRGSKLLNPNFFTLYDRDGQAYRYDRSTFARTDACRSTKTVRPGESASCSLIFVVPAGRSLRRLVFNDGASTDEVTF